MSVRGIDFCHRLDEEIRHGHDENAMVTLQDLRNAATCELACYVLNGKPFCDSIQEFEIVLSSLSYLGSHFKDRHLRLDVAKICRVFAEFCVLQAKHEGRVFPQDRKKLCLESLSAILRVVKAEQKENICVATVHEVESIANIIKLLDTDDSWAKNLILRTASAITQVPGVILNPTAPIPLAVAVAGAKLFLDFFLEVKEEIKKERTKQTVLINLSAQLVLKGPKEEFLPTFYRYIERYERDPKTAFVVLENLALFVKTLGYSPVFIQGSSDNQPGLIHFAHLEGAKFWNVRYRAIEHLNSFHNMELPSHTHTNQMLLALSQRFLAEKNTRVLSFLVETYKLLMNEGNPSWLSLVKDLHSDIEKTVSLLEAKHQQLSCALQANNMTSDEEESADEEEGSITALENRIEKLRQFLGNSTF